MLLYAGITTNTRPRWRPPNRRFEPKKYNLSKYKDLSGKKTYRFRNLRKWKDFNKKQLTLHKMCVTSLLCGPWANLWPFDGLYCKWYSKRFTVPEKEKRLGVEEKAERKRQPEIRLWNHVAWDHALSLLSLYVSHGKVFSLSSQRSKEAKKKQ